MRRSVLSRVVLLALVLLVGLGLPWSMSPAYADDDVITNMDVRFEVRADGTVGVTYRLDYRFGDTGRRGIVFSIIGREPYGDGIHDAVYEIDDIRVSSPSGAPADVDEFTETIDGSELTTLRIGDPDRTLNTRDASYLISFDIAGALETHNENAADQYAELYRDVTTDYPHIENYSVSVSAPGGVRDTECAAGPAECANSVDRGTARYSGTDLRAGEQLSIAAKLDPAQIANARPNLVAQKISDPRTLAVDSTTTLQPDGAVAVEQVTRYRFPDDGGTVTYEIPVRRAFSDTEDQLFEVTDVTVTDSAGVRVEHKQRVEEVGSAHTLEVAVDRDPATPDGITDLRLTYRVRNAFHPDPDDQTRALLRWPLLPEPAAPFTEVSAAYRAPAELTVDCEQGTTGAPCALPDPDMTGQRAVFHVPRDHEPPVGHDDEQVVVRVAADAVGNPVPVLGESLDRREMGRAGLSLLGTIGIWVALLTGALVSTRRPAFANQRYAAVPPGVVNHGGPVQDDPGLTVPVRFEPPETDLATAGWLLDGGYEDRHTTAEMVGAAVLGVTRIQLQPLTLWRGPRPEQPVSTWFSPVMAAVTRAAGDQRPATPQELTALVRAVQTHQPSPEANSPLFLDWSALRQLKRRRRLRGLAGFAIISAILIGLAVALRPVLGAWGGGMAFFGIIAAAIACLVWANRVRRVPLSATGTALHDQIIGFRTYLTTAEAHQLRFEAGQDIYSRYLPWAVLFDITDKWTATCQQLVAMGALRPLRTGWIDQPPERLGFIIHDLERDLSRSVATTTAAANAASRRYSSGSGGRSAFSGRGISSGGGGGGTSSRSW